MRMFPKLLFSNAATESTFFWVQSDSILNRVLALHKVDLGFFPASSDHCQE